MKHHIEATKLFGNKIILLHLLYKFDSNGILVKMPNILSFGLSLHLHQNKFNHQQRHKIKGYPF